MLMDRCLMCGKEAELDERGFCRDCGAKAETGLPPFNSPERKVYDQVDKIGRVPQKYERVDCLLPTWKIISALNSFYKFFKKGIIIICSISAVIWLLYCAVGSYQNGQDQLTASQNYLRGGGSAVVQAFNPHWEAIIAIILILIIGIFLAYLSQAVAKIVEKVTENDYKN